MIVGQGPDIIVGWSVFDLDETEFLVDLQIFIDSDPYLNMDDFLPNIIDALKSGDGRLQIISNGLNVWLYSAVLETVNQVGAFTYENIIRWLGESDTRHLGDEWMNREWFVVESLLSFNDEFINFETGAAQLDSREFIDLLNIAYRLPEPEQFALRDERASLLSAEQLLTLTIFGNIDSYRGIIGGWLDGLGEIVHIGVPSNIAGQHSFELNADMVFGINAGSPHQEIAWSFV